VVLNYLSHHTVDKYETKLKIGYPAQRALSRKVWKDFFFVGLVVMGLPTMAVGLLVEWLLGTREIFLLENWHIVYLYPASVYANYRHVLWREKNLSHLSESKRSEGNNENHAE